MMMRFTILFFTSHLFILTSVFSQPRPGIPAEQPKLVVGIIISQMRSDYLSRYWDKLDPNGFRKLIERGTVCKNTGYSYLLSDEGVGHATIVTGANPSGHGIVAREWYVSLQDKIVSSTGDNRFKTTGSSTDAGKLSPANLMAITFSDELRLSNNQKSRVYSISLDGAAAVIAGGHTANASWWFDEAMGNFITSSYYTDSLPGWLREFNDKKFADLYTSREWVTLFPLSEYTESFPDNNKYETGLGGNVVFPYRLADLSKAARRSKNYDILRMTPFGNNLLKDMAVNAIVGENMGMTGNTDVLFVSFSATEQIGKLFGPNSVEMQDAILRLDKDIVHFVDFLESHLGKENVLIFVTADHGLAHSPNYLTDMKIPGGYLNPGSVTSLLGAALNNVYGKGTWIKAYHRQQVYLNRNLIEDSKLSLPDFQHYVAQFVLQFSGVANTMTANTLQSTAFPVGVFNQMQNGFNQKTSGDVIINLRPGWAEKGSVSSTQGHGYAYDNRVPLIWYGWKVGRGKITRYVDLTDIAPTICSFLEIALPNTSTGHPITELLD